MNKERLRWLALLGVPFLLLWQLSIVRTDLQPTHKARVGGLHSQDRFVYFLYYKNLFPVATMESGRDWDFYFSNDEVQEEPNRLTYSAEAAQRILTEKGSSLVQEWGHTIRNENHLQTFLYLPDAWRRGTPKDAESRITNAVVFMLGLTAIYVAFFLSRRFALGLFLVLFLGSNPFQLFAAYREENILSWPITMFCVAAALAAPMIAGRTLPWQFWAPLGVFTGFLFGTAYQIRSETVAAMMGLVAVVLTLWERPWRSRLAQVGVLIVAFGGTLLAWNAYFEKKIAESSQVVARAGGHVYPGPLQGHHPLWASLWPGLGDFDRTHGYNLGDAAAITYLEPLMRSRFNEEMPWWWGTSREKQPRVASDYYDAARIYYRYPFDSPHTATLLREKVIHDVTHDPLWYAGILAKRVWRILNQTTPVQLYVNPSITLPLPFHGLIAVAIFGVAWWRRDWTALRLLLLSLPLSLTPLVITSAANFTYFSIYHLSAAAIGLSWAAFGVRRWWETSRVRPARTRPV
jgi:hypothetical protein